MPGDKTGKVTGDYGIMTGLGFTLDELLSLAQLCEQNTEY